jgi:Xaa-Pro aminopeptidase
MLAAEPTPEPPPPYRRPPNLLPFPNFSLVERDRRWTLVRQTMRQRGVAYLIVPSGPRHSRWARAIARYLTHVGGGNARVGVVFPLEGEPTAFVSDPEDWTQTQPWCHDLRPLPQTGTAELVEVLQRTQSGDQSVGIVGDTANLVPVSHQEGAGVVDWIDLTADIERIRAIKSAEEIAFLQRSARIVDAALMALERLLTPGMRDYELWATVLQRECALGSELPIDVRWAMDPISHLTDLSRGPTFRQVDAGSVLIGTIDAAWGGYHAGAMATFTCAPPSSSVRDLTAVVNELWNDSLGHIAPGRDLAELLAYVDAAASQASRRGGPAGSVSVVPVLWGCGLGRDLPRLPATGSTAWRDPTRVEAGWCFFWGLIARSDEGSAAVGDSIVVEATGARRLGTDSMRLRQVRS